jgi:hypothetical protein
MTNPPTPAIGGEAREPAWTEIVERACQRVIGAGGRTGDNLANSITAEIVRDLAGWEIRRATPAAEPQRVKVVAMDSSNELGREYALVPATAPGMVTEDAIRSALVWGTDVLHGEQLDKAVQSVMAAIAAADPAPGEGE